jgi:hypothetical protein
MSEVLERPVETLLERQVDALLARVREAAARARWDLEADTSTQVEAILDAARREARTVVHAAAREKRERVAEHCRQARAAAETRDRSGAFAADAELCRRARLALPDALERRWQDADARREWCRAAVALAARRLAARDWTIVAATGLDARERDDLVRLAGERGATLTWSGEAPPRAGLRLAARDVTIDATPDGLLADATDVEARVLALQREPRDSR